MNETEKVPLSFFFTVFLTLFLAIAYNTITNMAGVYIAFDLGGTSEISVYPMVLFSLGNALTIPIATPLADRVGSVRLLVYTLLVYTFFSILCSLATTFVLFNIFRFGLGLSAGFFFILCRRLLVRFAPPSRVKSYLFFMTMFYTAVPVFGACLGAWIAYESHWRWIFHMNQPIALFLVGYFWLFFKDLDPPSSLKKEPFDLIGYLFFCLGIGSLVIAAATSQQLDWYRSDIFLFLLSIGIPSFLFFILWSLNQPNPFLKIKLLSSYKLSYALVNLGVLFASYFGMIILIALWLNLYVNYTPLWVAALIGIMGASCLAAYLLIKRLLEAFDPRLTLAIAILCLSFSCYYSTYFNVDIDFFHLAVARFLAGLGLALFLFPLVRIADTSYGGEKLDDIFTLFQSTRALFSALGAALYVILWQRRHVFFYERLGEGVTVNGQTTAKYFEWAKAPFRLSQGQSTEELSVLLDTHSTSLALNDVFGFMGYLLVGLFALLLLSFLAELSKGEFKSYKSE